MSAPTPTLPERVHALEQRLHLGLKAMVIVVLVMAVGIGGTAWQIHRAFQKQDAERLARVGASASINAFLCQRIDSVGNKVGSLVRVSLSNSPPPSQLEPLQRLAYERFLRYAQEQERPPRCRELALKIATLTGADPSDVKFTPIHLHAER